PGRAGGAAAARGRGDDGLDRAARAAARRSRRRHLEGDRDPPRPAVASSLRNRARRYEVAEASAEEWIASFAGAVGAEPPDDEQIGRLLKLAAVAAHSSERIAAP